MTLNGEQSSALQALIDFLGSTTQIFILKGYAGTGKTTLMKSLLEHFKSSQEKRPIRVFAPTGRAAKILQEKGSSSFLVESCSPGLYNRQHI